jgi:hypothetical protein
VTFTAPATGGGQVCNARLFSLATGKVATSGTVTLQAPPAPSITGPASVVAGGTISFTIANGPGAANDWVGWYCPSTATDAAYLDWKYLNNTKTAPATGLTAATVTFTAPATGGQACNARLFSLATGKLATSGAVSITP